MKPLCIDLFCGLGGWSEGFLAEGYRCMGFDLERHDYGTGGYPGQLVLQDVLTLHGSQFCDASVIVASPPCQAYSYMAMPWSRAKREISWQEWERDSPFGDFHLNDLFDACFRIQREASKAAGWRIPLVVENVKGAQRWVGDAAWHFGSYYLWGDVPALMPFAGSVGAGTKQRGSGPEWFDTGIASLPSGSNGKKSGGGASWFPVSHGQRTHEGTYGNNPARGEGVDGVKTVGHVNIRDGHSYTRHLTCQRESDAVKVSGDWFGSYAEMKAAGTISPGRLYGKGSSRRKAASAQIAKIPFELASWIARCYKPVSPGVLYA